MSTASTILQQLGGSRFVTMTGARNLMDVGNGLSFRIGRNTSGANCVKVTLDGGTDTYTVKFSRLRGTDLKLVEERDLVYWEDLPHLFESITGLRTSL